MQLSQRRKDSRHGERVRPGKLAPLNVVKNTFKTVLAVLVLLYLLLRLQFTSIIRRLLFDEERIFGLQSLDGAPYHPKISLIGIWTGTDYPNYMTWFLESIARQPEEVELILIQRGSALVSFEDTPAYNARNIKVVQMSDARYWDLHREYFCKRWGCSEVDRRRIDRHLRDVGAHDPQSYSLSILRGEVFKSFIHPGAEWWGWCDFDTVMGSFKRKFPWDIAQDYDVILPVHRNTDPQRLLFMRGHLTFFRNTQQSSDKITGHPDFATKEGWLSLRDFHHKETCRKHKTLGCSPKEASYSSYIVNNPAINFLSFDGLAQKHFLAMTPNGTYALSSGLNDKKRAALVAERMLSDKQSTHQPDQRPPTFSDLGQVRNITLVQGTYSTGSLWFHPNYSTHYVPTLGNGDPSFRNDDYLTYVYRLDGRTQERLEPVSKVVKRPDVMEEWLYLHWQEEKNKYWFQDIPEEVAGTEDWILLTQGHGKGGFWKLVYRSSNSLDQLGMGSSDSISSIVTAMASLSINVTLPYDIVIEIGAFCAGSLQFRSLLNVALTCRVVYQVLKPMLRHRITAWNINILKAAWQCAFKRTNVVLPPSWKQVE
ncbi:hypothetical protein QFC22_006606 [Naganishia vaughanmartiniae]|uniref:Uncharacterized protein n=1 Tax=Naganishia vaughanmartiniae TaxID=1424756 RepID=A0ACC2WII5_9TREE|nr:hypothetical protein QFC22_006606 [Naganishia vaughanmartiniae]